MTRNENYEWYISANMESHEGKWVVIVNRKVVAEGNDIKKILTESRKKYPSEESLLVKVPKKETLVL